MRTKFLLWLNGEEGCDYSINCGTKIIALDAQEFDAARIEAEAKFEDFDIEQIILARIISTADIVDLNFQKWKTAKIEARKSKINKQNAERERQEYERLRMKFDPARSDL